MNIGIIVGSTRPNRAGRSVGDWVANIASQRTDATYELIDLADYNLVLLDEPTIPGAANRQYENAQTRAWSATIDRFDGFVFVTAEYNHSIPAAFKNAVDVLGPEWADKSVAFVSYGADNGVRAVEHWRGVVANLRMHATRGAVALSLFTEFGPDGFAPIERRQGELTAVLDELVPLTSAVRVLRAPAVPAASETDEREAA